MGYILPIHDVQKTQYAERDVAAKESTYRFAPVYEILKEHGKSRLDEEYRQKLDDDLEEKREKNKEKAKEGDKVLQGYERSMRNLQFEKLQAEVTGKGAQFSEKV